MKKLIFKYLAEELLRRLDNTAGWQKGAKSDKRNIEPGTKEVSSLEEKRRARTGEAQSPKPEVKIGGVALSNGIVFYSPLPGEALLW